MERLIVVRNINRTNNSARAITYQVEVNMYYKSHVKRIRIDVYNLEKINVILRILWLQTHNLEFNWETGEVKMMRCPPLCRKNMKLEEENKIKKEKRIVMLEKKKTVR